MASTFLKKLCAGLVPDAILDRPKQGFSIPLAQWLRQDLKNVFQERVLEQDSFSQTLFENIELENMWNQHQRGLKDYSYHLWALLMLESWARKFSI